MTSRRSSHLISSLLRWGVLSRAPDYAQVLSDAVCKCKFGNEGCKSRASPVLPHFKVFNSHFLLLLPKLHAPGDNKTQDIPTWIWCHFSSASAGVVVSHFWKIRFNRKSMEIIQRLTHLAGKLLCQVPRKETAINHPALHLK